MKLINALENVSYTRNGMIGYSTTYTPIVDFNYFVSSFRRDEDSFILEKFNNILSSSECKYALRYLFYLRDINEGLGERRLFRVCLLSVLDRCNKSDVVNVIESVKDYARFDDLLVLLNTKYENILIEYIKDVLDSDLKNMKENKSISLLAKWLPSINASNIDTRKNAKIISKKLGMNCEEYRKLLSKLRKYLDIVEVKLSNKEFSEIDYNKVPSQANLKYRYAFLRNDKERRIEYLENLAKGDAGTKINAKTLMPHQILSKYRMIGKKDELLEKMWSSLADVNLSNLEDTIVVRDGSGSMGMYVGRGTTALDIATALAIYTSQRLPEPYKNSFITFSSKPRFVKFKETDSLFDKIETANRCNQVANTNIEAVFRLILSLAISNKLKSEDMLKQVVIISDMEFDACSKYDKNVFEVVKEDYEKNGYKLPKLVFWNVNNYNRTIPCKEKDNGIFLISGYSQSSINLVCQDRDDTLSSLINILESDRYNKLPLLDSNI